MAKTKRVFSALLAAVVIFVSLTAVRADDSDYEPYEPSPILTAEEIKHMITGEAVNALRGSVRLRGERPYAQNGSCIESTAFAQALNGRFEEQFTAFLQLAAGVTRSLVFSYEVTVSGQYVSIMFFCERNAAATEQHVSTTVIDSFALHILSLCDVLGVNGEGLVNLALAPRIAAEPARFAAAFAGVGCGQSFFVEDGCAVLMFSEFELMRTRTGISTLRINPADIINVTVAAEHVRTSGGITMLPLRMLITDFGYYPHWTAATRSVNVASEDSGASFSFTIGDPRLLDLHRPGQTLLLDTAPQIYNDRTYMPLSFFTQSLGLVENVNADGSMTFSRFDGEFEIKTFPEYCSNLPTQTRRG